MMEAIYLPRLNHLTPTLYSTLLKITEEAGELSRAVLLFLPYQECWTGQDEQAGRLLADVASELLDVAQTCVTMIFVMEDNHGICADDLIGEHINKLAVKGYRFATDRSYQIATAGSYKCLALPRLDIPAVSLLTTVCKIQEELGELTQYLGKRAGASGENGDLTDAEALHGSALELLDVAQCCFTMMYILGERYAVDMATLAAEHVSKLRRKGYCD